MATMLKKAAEIRREEGLSTLTKQVIRFGYDSLVRPMLPKRVVSYNGVPVRASRLGDSLVPWRMGDIIGYESALVKGIGQYVESGDTVVVVGGGWGVSTVVAANQVGDGGQVITFEAGAETVEKVTDTIQLNDVEDRVSIRHSVVAKAISIRGDGSGAQVVPPTKLPDCDVLVLDCEGAEIDILTEMEIRPRAVLVETHGMFNAPETAVRDTLDRTGYETVERMVAEERLRGICEENGIYVLFAIQRQSTTDKKLLTNDCSLDV